MGAVRKADEINIVLYYKPKGKLRRKHFFNWKKRYAIDLCPIYHFDKRITSIPTGFSNPIYNIQVLGNTNIHFNPTVYLFLGQYILRNIAYTSTKYIVLLYKIPEANYLKNHICNKQLFSIQIDLENTFEILKKR